MIWSGWVVGTILMAAAGAVGSTNPATDADTCWECQTLFDPDGNESGEGCHTATSGGWQNCTTICVQGGCTCSGTGQQCSGFASLTIDLEGGFAMDFSRESRRAGAVSVNVRCLVVSIGPARIASVGTYDGLQFARELTAEEDSAVSHAPSN
jgi:hypothetical protein